MPYIDYINDYITQFKDKQTKNEKLLYFKNLKRVRKVAIISEYVAWTLCLVIVAVYCITSDNYGVTELVKDNSDAWVI